MGVLILVLGPRTPSATLLRVRNQVDFGSERAPKSLGHCPARHSLALKLRDARFRLLLVVTGCAQPAPQCHASEYENTQLEKSQKSQEQDFCRFLLLRIEAHVRPIIFFAQRLVIVYQGLVRIPESKNINLWRVRKFSLEKLCRYPHFRTDNKSPKTFELIN